MGCGSGVLRRGRSCKDPRGATSLAGRRGAGAVEVSGSMGAAGVCVKLETSAGGAALGGGGAWGR